MAITTVFVGNGREGGARKQFGAISPDIVEIAVYERPEVQQTDGDFLDGEQPYMHNILPNTGRSSTEMAEILQSIKQTLM